MKNKESFLKELQNGLAVLAESEQQDILAEYAQHIDMRIAGGLTEEEAIQDFGDIHQLTAEILAAYHVNPAYSRAPGKLPDPRPALSRAWSHTGNFFRRLGHGLAVFFSRAGRRLPLFPTALQRGSASSSGGQTSCNKKVRNVLCRSPKNPAPYLAGSSEPVRLSAGFSTVPETVSSACAVFWPGCCGTSHWHCARSPFGRGLAALLLFGVLMVWLVQGLPLTGAVLGCVGITAFCAGVLGLGSGLIWHRHRPASAQADTVPPRAVYHAGGIGEGGEPR